MERSVARASYKYRDSSGLATRSAVHWLIGVRSTTRLFGCMSTHPSWPLSIPLPVSLSRFLSLTMRAGPSDRPDPLVAALHRVRGVADLTEGVVALVRLGPLSPHHVYLSLSLFLRFFWSASRGPILPSHLTSTIALWWPLFLPFSFPLPLRPRFLIIILFLQFPHRFFLSLSVSLPLSLYSYPTYCPFLLNLDCSRV